MDERALALIDRFGAAAVDGDHWLPALTALAEATGSRHGQLIGIGGPAAIAFNWVNDFDAVSFRKFVALDGGNPLVNSRVAASVETPVLAIQSEQDYAAVQPRLISTDYADFCRDVDIPYGCQTKLVEDAGSLIGLAVLRGENDGPTNEAQRAFFAAIAPHVRSAVRTQTALEHEGVRLMCNALEAVSAAVFICTQDGSLRAMTPAAEHLLGGGRMTLAEGRLGLPSLRETEMLHRTLARHAGSVRLPLETLMLSQGEGALPLILDIVATPGKIWNLGFLPKMLVIARSGSRWHGSAIPLLTALYGLSHAEADVALRLARGESREAIAEARGARLATVRAQLKNAFAKLGINREVELVAMLGTLLRI